MTYVSFAAGNAARYERHGLYQNLMHHTLPGIAVLGLSALVGAGMLYMHPPAQRNVERIAQAPQVSAAVTANTVAKVFSAKKFVPPVLDGNVKSEGAPKHYASVLDPSYTFGLAPTPFKAKTAIASALEPTPMVPPPSSAPTEGPITSDSDEVPPPIVANVEPAAPLPEVAVSDVPLPLPRPHEFRLPADVVSGPARPERQRVATAAPAAVAPAASAPVSAVPQSGGFFEKLFGGASRPPGPALAYAAPEDGGGILGGLSRLGASRPAPISDRFTAVYDISAHTVHMPDGTVLEAHSGIGYMQDNPQYVDQRMRGATPPAVYELTEREALFHGVRALRLTPVQGSTFGRGGLLAHTFMLGPSGNSNGCVVFRNYNAFLQAYLRGDIKHLAVVARL